MKTKYGTARINKEGYYWITSRKEGNNGKLLHRLIAEDYFGEWINDPEEPFDIHHIDGNKLNNCVLNLEPIPHSEHQRLHNKGKTLSDEHKQKISESLTGKTLSDEHKQKISESLTGKTHSDETKKKISEANKGKNHHMYGKHHSEESKQKISEARNTSGYFRVYKNKNKECKQGFIWRYTYYDENGKTKAITSVSIDKLKQKVEARGLPWKKL